MEMAADTNPDHLRDVARQWREGGTPSNAKLLEAAADRIEYMTRTINRIPHSRDGYPLIPGDDVFVFNPRFYHTQPRRGHIVNIWNGSRRATIALKAPAQNQSTPVECIYHTESAAWEAANQEPPR